MSPSLCRFANLHSNDAKALRRSKHMCAADSIINPEAPLALRLSGQLLLGVVKVYSKKVGYLFQDCNDALVKVKQVYLFPLVRIFILLKRRNKSTPFLQLLARSLRERPL